MTTQRVGKTGSRGAHGRKYNKTGHIPDISPPSRKARLHAVETTAGGMGRTLGGGSGGGQTLGRGPADRVQGGVEGGRSQGGDRRDLEHAEQSLRALRAAIRNESPPWAEFGNRSPLCVGLGDTSPLGAGLRNGSTLWAKLRNRIPFSVPQSLIHNKLTLSHGAVGGAPLHALAVHGFFLHGEIVAGSHTWSDITSSSGSAAILRTDGERLSSPPPGDRPGTVPP